MKEIKTKIEIRKDLYEKAKAFQEVIEAVNGEKMELNDCIEVILDRGINAMFEDLFANVEPIALMQSLQQLGAQHPDEVYHYIAETLRRGSEINREELKTKFGFRAD